ncbi:MAG: tRNA pseudouridine(38-40) synthase TruA [Deltaproteobacteria bacterium]|nr:tRNA pseudouridine(38-40) synthase TruA [Deltaproteobacteria bacterium]
MEIQARRFKLVVEFDGSRYSGWQKQDDARTIQGALLKVASGLYGEPVDVQGNGRTDGGVHGLRFVAHLEANTADSAGEVGRRVNELLPQDINILGAQKAGPRFHARHNCIGRSYLYQIAKRRTAFCNRYVWRIPEPLRAKPMQETATLLAGMHDFTSFTDRQVIKKKSPLVMIHKTQVVETDDLILIRLVGSHFLWKMVRRIVGVLAETGRGNLAPAEVDRFLAEPVNLSHFTAPAQGLFFERAFYNQEELDSFLATDDIRPAFF